MYSVLWNMFSGAVSVKDVEVKKKRTLLKDNIHISSTNEVRHVIWKEQESPAEYYFKIHNLVRKLLKFASQIF